VGKRFYKFSQQLPGFWNYGNWYRMDGATGVITSLVNNYSCNYLINERYVDSLKSRKNDTLRKCGSPIRAICIDTSNATIFGIPTKNRAFREDGIILYERYYSKYFGLTKVYTWEITGSWENLVGCKINGVTYGDTLLTGVENISAEVPGSYSLGQNYPNPFNPSTVVSFQLSVVSDVSLKVYDVQGREVQTLVNERLNAGTYEVKFDGSMLTSGVYFYRLFTDGFSDAKKMLLIK
ncbi:MAG: T9SS type A sorting domain-containing protein, partial [Ignavibacteria bacterium]